VRTSGEKLVAELYQGKFVYKVECDACHTVSEREEAFYDVVVNVKGFKWAVVIVVVVVVVVVVIVVVVVVVAAV